MKIAVYSGSFNPMHEGHLAIISRLERDFDKVLVVVSPESPFKAGNAKSGGERHDAARNLVENRPEDPMARCRAEIDDIEYHLPSPLYTINTLRAIREREQAVEEKAVEILLATGADCLFEITRWYAYKDILTEFGLYVFPRQGYDLPSLKETLVNENPNYRVILVEDAPLVNISSTIIRSKQPTHHE